MKTKIIQFLKQLPSKTMDFIIHFPQNLKKAAHITIIFTSFFLLLIFFVISLVVGWVRKIPFLGRFITKVDPFWNANLKPWYEKILNKFESMRPFKVKRRYLIYIAYQNLLIRKGRSLITIFGMSVGVGIIVYLLSLGYGIEKLVISQVASLEELQMVDVSAGESSTASLSKDAIKKMSGLDDVAKTIPIISVVGRLNYKNAKTDMLVYAVPKDYFIASNKNVKHGSYFSKNSDINSLLAKNGDVQGAETEFPRAVINTPITSYHIIFSPLPQVTMPVWEDCRIESKLLGYTTRTEGTYSGYEFWGNDYAPFNPYGRVAYDSKNKSYLGKWVRGEFPLYAEKEDDSLDPILDNNGRQQWQTGCVQRKNIQIIDEIKIKGEVLGESTASASVSGFEASSSADFVASDSANLDEQFSSEFSGASVATNEAGLEIISLDKQVQPEKTEQVLKFKGQVLGEAVVSSAVLKLLNIPAAQATNEGFNISFIIIKSLMPSVQGRILTEEVAYKIVGVVDDDENQFIYIPIEDITGLGVQNFSQAKLILKDQKYMPEVRKLVESMGYKTSSTVDTIAQIESFFGGLRSVLGVIGFIALGVASLGMFNTLTVSLLERTREIGGMKTMGMVSGEIQELFLAEAMIMGFGGGIGGLLLGIMVGQTTSYLVSIVAITQGVGYLELTYVPSSLVLFIVGCSFVVGVLTGLYPSHRAKKISALNALRYE